MREGASNAQEELPHGQLVHFVGRDPCLHGGVLWDVSGFISGTMCVTARGACFVVPVGVLHVIAHLGRQAVNGEGARERRVVKVDGTKRKSPNFRHGRT